MEGGNSVVTLKDGVIQLVDAMAAKGVDKRPKQQIEFAADHLFIRFDTKGVLQSVTGDQNAKLKSTAPTAETRTSSDRVDLEFVVENEDSVLKKALAMGNASIESTPVPRAGVPTPDTRVMKSNIIAVHMRPGGEEIDKVSTEAPGTIEFRPNRPGQKKRIVNGDGMNVEYAPENQLKAFSAFNVTTRTESEPVKGKPQPPALTSSKGMAAEFDPKTGVMKKLEQWDDFQYEEGDRRATSNRAELHGPNDEVYLSGKARIWDKSGSTAADTITMRQKSGEFEAAGNVSSTRLPDKKKDGKPGMLSSDEALQAKASKMVSSQDNTHIVYEGNALLWQGPNRIEADRVSIDRKSGRLEASGNVRTQLLEKPDPKAKQKTERVFTIVRAPELEYDDKQGLAHYKGGSRLERGAVLVTAKEIRAFLKSGDADASLDHAVADGAVKIVQGGPKGSSTGVSEHAEYYADDGKLVLSGGQPQFVDSQGRKTQGRQITHFTGKDQLIVEGEEGRRVESRIPRRSR
jgi:lipopolysaccharide export system protein LptA